ncbi:MAG TPA: FlgD immunoglobulin-like domain containing protein [bacterium]|nr:FlgD immunoglobulin-like domain containing protein [bacterium]HOX85381.1 FlgD immunoglobulin-like domain containing protein [bacterium]HPG44540.1 FlgD immunoglobulin-like domain containing protein [bacterium]HPM97098.1 FlgD immunoglobulin-like domain containing protein [bacterium]
MNTRYRNLLFAATLIFAGSGQGQIQFTADDFSQFVNTSHVLQTDTMETRTVNVGSAGANQIYDFSSLSLSGPQMNTTFLNASATPFFAMFPGATHAAKMMEKNVPTSDRFYHYLNVSNSGITSLGMVYANQNDQLQGMDQDDEFTPVPLVYNKQWQTQSSDTLSAGGFVTINSMQTKHHIDGWGKIRLPIGEQNCLRWRQDVTIISTSTYGGMTLAADTSVTVDFNFIGKNSVYYALVSGVPDDDYPDVLITSDVSVLAELSRLTDVEDRETVILPDEFVLLPNFPNPFNPQTQLSFHLPKHQHVRLEIYNSLGQNVRTLVDQPLADGLHTLTWDGRDQEGNNLASGNFLVVLQAADQQRVQTITLLK